MQKKPCARVLYVYMLSQLVYNAGAITKRHALEHAVSMLFSRICRMLCRPIDDRQSDRSRCTAVFLAASEQHF